MYCVESLWLVYLGGTCVEIIFRIIKSFKGGEEDTFACVVQICMYASVCVRIYRNISICVQLRDLGACAASTDSPDRLLDFFLSEDLWNDFRCLYILASAFPVQLAIQSIKPQNPTN